MSVVAVLSLLSTNSDKKGGQRRKIGRHVVGLFAIVLFFFWRAPFLSVDVMCRGLSYTNSL